MYSCFNNITYDHRILVLEPFNERSGERFRTKVFGQTCGVPFVCLCSINLTLYADSVDVVSENCMLPNLELGERIFVRKMGSYSLSSASSSFNGFSAPATAYVFTV